MDELLTKAKEMVRQDLHLAVDFLQQRHWSTAILYLEKAYGRTWLLEDEELKYQILFHLMSAYLHSDFSDRYARIEECFQELSRLKIANYSLRPEILRLRGVALVRQGRFEEGIQVFLQLAQLPKERGILLAWAYLSEIYLIQHKMTAKKTLNLAKHYSFKILDQCIEKPFFRKEKAWALHQLGHIFYTEKSYAQALPYFREKLEVTEEPVSRYWIYLDLAETFLAMEQTSRGFQYLKESESFFKRHDSLVGLGQTYFLRGKYLIHEGQKEQGEALFLEAMEIFLKSGEYYRLYQTLQELTLVINQGEEQRWDLREDLNWWMQSYILQEIIFG